ncbi:uncharacterized protein LOC131634101 [Vicia villosa]|uniref:uncharacterized protein LOC131634101 n=1 Tax=Vicia villosa TaxID=3911 RepID=UPI00273AF92F|nr:uncharacterized protein LOC131634101 [Vicia villosa]
MPRASAFTPLRGNQVPDPYRHALDRMAVEDIRYCCHDEHWEAVPFDKIALYSGWLVASSTIVVCYLLERVMRQFEYEQTIPRDPTFSTPLSMAHRQLDEVFADWEQDMVPKEARATLAEHVWSCAEGYITWYYRVSHSYMLPAAEGGPPRPAHEEILRSQQAQLDHTKGLLPLCRQIADGGDRCHCRRFIP